METINTHSGEGSTTNSTRVLKLNGENRGNLVNPLLSVRAFIFKNMQNNFKNLGIESRLFFITKTYEDLKNVFLSTYKTS